MKFRVSSGVTGADCCRACRLLRVRARGAGGVPQAIAAKCIVKPSHGRWSVDHLR
jgi:hypothetical protein